MPITTSSPVSVILPPTAWTAAAEVPPTVKSPTLSAVPAFAVISTVVAAPVVCTVASILTLSVA